MGCAANGQSADGDDMQRLADKFDHAAQVRIAGGAQPFEHHLGSDNLDAVMFKTADCRLLVFGAARSDGIASSSRRALAVTAEAPSIAGISRG